MQVGSSLRTRRKGIIGAGDFRILEFVVAENHKLQSSARLSQARPLPGWFGFPNGWEGRRGSPRCPGCPGCRIGADPTTEPPGIYTAAGLQALALGLQASGTAQALRNADWLINLAPAARTTHNANHAISRPTDCRSSPQCSSHPAEDRIDKRLLPYKTRRHFVLQFRKRQGNWIREAVGTYTDCRNP